MDPVFPGLLERPQVPADPDDPRGKSSGPKRQADRSPDQPDADDRHGFQSLQDSYLCPDSAGFVRIRRTSFSESSSYQIAEPADESQGSRSRGSAVFRAAGRAAAGRTAWACAGRIRSRSDGVGFRSNSAASRL